MPADGRSRPGAVVIGGGHSGLAIVRSLGRRDIPVWVVDDAPPLARYSRYTRRTIRVAQLADQRHTVDALLELGRRHALDGWVLFPTRDETAAAFASHRPLLAERFRVPTPEWDSMRWAWSKRDTYALAERLGLPTPRTWHPRSGVELTAIDAPFPLVVKPMVKQHFERATGAKAWRADGPDQLATLYERAAGIVGADGVMIQELIPGDGDTQFAYCALFDRTRPLASMVVLRRRQHPPEFGRASTCVETVERPELEGPSERLLRAIDYHGLVEVEYKLDARDGRPKLLDVNARAWGYHLLGQAAGVDFPYLLYAHQTGLPVPPCRGRPGVRWVRLKVDVPLALRRLATRDLRLAEYMRTLRPNVEAVFDRSDPIPTLADLLTPA